MMPKILLQMLNAGLRLVTLVAKLGLTLYMGRFFPLSDMGVYGLVLGASMFLSWVLGMKLDYVVSREIVGADPATIIHRMRDQAIFYTANYLLLALAGVAVVSLGLYDVSPKIVFFIVAISIAEGYASMVYANMNSLGQPIYANILFFIRAGLWVFPVVIFGLLSPELRNVDVVLVWWFSGVIMSLLGTIWAWRRLPWGKAFSTPVDWDWLRQGTNRCFFIWLGAVGIAGGTYVDRFVVAHYLDLDYAGIATFYTSFAVALLTLNQSGVLAFSYPRMIKLYRDNDAAGFRHEVRQTLWHVALFAGAISLIVGIVVPILAHYLQKPRLEAEAFTLWLMMFAVWVRANSDTLNYILYARHQDRALWLGNLLFLIPAFGGNLIFVPWLGISGMGYGMIAAAGFILLWRLWHVLYGKIPTIKFGSDDTAAANGV